MKKIWSNNKGTMSNETFETITNILWVIAVISMFALLFTMRELSKEVKGVKQELERVNRFK